MQEKHIPGPLLYMWERVDSQAPIFGVTSCLCTFGPQETSLLLKVICMAVATWSIVTILSDWIMQGKVSWKKSLAKITIPIEIRGQNMVPAYHIASKSAQSHADSHLQCVPELCKALGFECKHMVTGGFLLAQERVSLVIILYRVHGGLSYSGLLHAPLKNSQWGSGQMVQLVGPLCSTPKGCRFNPQSGYMWEAANQCFSLTLMFLSLSPFFSL